VLPLNDVESTDTGTDMHANTLGVCRSYFQTRVGYRFVGGGKGEMDEAPHFARFLFVHKIQWIEVFHLSRECYGETRRIEAADWSHSALAGQQIIPDLGRGLAYSA
jgi:hypothetical protein